jgi:quercetin dioxygenase-like cupin family protein
MHQPLSQDGPMSQAAEPISRDRTDRPAVSEVLKDATGGSSFTVTFLAGQVLPTHQNPSRVLINVLTGDGTITVSDGRESLLAVGKIVQVAANAPHSLVAGHDGLVIEVHLVADCCGAC